MAEITLAAETGRPTGSRASNRLRLEGRVPGVVYGHGADAVTVSVERRDLRHALTTEAGLNALIELDIAGRRELAMVKTLQRHPVRREVTHVDFVRVSRDEAMTVEVPVVLHGEAELVQRADGVIDQVMHSLTITAKPADIPNELAFDISALDIGDSVRVSDLTLPAGVTTEVDADEPVAMAKIEAVELPVEEEVEGEEAVEGEAGEAGAEAGAEGAEASSGGGEGE
jgi:large subunit ribosomal protein L25